MGRREKASALLVDCLLESGIPRHPAPNLIRISPAQPFMFCGGALRMPCLDEYVQNIEDESSEPPSKRSHG